VHLPGKPDAAAAMLPVFDARKHRAFRRSHRSARRSAFVGAAAAAMLVASMQEKHRAFRRSHRGAARLLLLWERRAAPAPAGSVRRSQRRRTPSTAESFIPASRIPSLTSTTRTSRGARAAPAGRLP
jgi:hypothetical protein